MKKYFNFPRTVLVLSLVSFLTDVSSEMIYPLLPIFLSTTLGASPWALGLIEGLAESIAAFLKLYSGVWSDRGFSKKKFVLIGYGISGFLRPLVGLAQSWVHVLIIRCSDRVGKGLRTSPRDALLNESVGPETRGAAFGFHRSMDHAGAVVGPLLASALMGLFFFTERQVFLWALVPSTLAWLAAWILIPKDSSQKIEKKAPQTPSIFNFEWSAFGPSFRRILIALLIFTLGNSSDAFLLMKLNQAGIQASWLGLLWALHHVVKMLTSQWGGRLSDTWGRSKTLISGWALYCVVYILFACELSPTALVLVFLVYGAYYGLTEATEKAWMVDLAPKKLQGTALGLYNSVVGFGSLPASLVFGFIWQQFGPSAAFVFGSLCAVIGTLLILTVPRTPQPNQKA